ncbi:MAG: hypothetical protein IH948_05980 [Bacteroidetes bacterium]|nr:hypothetical protein [Bacteroidota bacterium]
MSAFKPSRAGSMHEKNMKSALRKLKGIESLNLNSTDEKDYENRIAGVLKDKFKNDFVDQRDTQQTMTRVTMFDHDHRPDMSIGPERDRLGIAIEIKVAKSGDSIRQAIGQSFIYRMDYRYVIVVLIDPTKEKRYLNTFGKKEKKFSKELEANKIYLIIK